MLFFRPTDDQQQQNAMDSSGLMHLIATGGGTNVTDNVNDESVVTVPTDDQKYDHTDDQKYDDTDDQRYDHTDDQKYGDTDDQKYDHTDDQKYDDTDDPKYDHTDDHADDQTNEQISEQLPDENIPEDQQELPVHPSSSIALPMDTEQQTTTIATTDDQSEQPQQQTTKNPHDIAEIHREMLTLIPIPQAWSHIRHQSGLFSYPDLPHFNVIRQATFREGRFVCPFCTVDFASKEGIRYHLYNSCTKSPYPKAFFRCLMCGSELADRSSLRTHLARHVCYIFLLFLF
jgi:transposase-like protein